MMLVTDLASKASGLEGALGFVSCGTDSLGEGLFFYRFAGISLQSAAACVRASWVTCKEWRVWDAVLDDKATDCPLVPLSALHGGRMAPGWWDSMAIAKVLAGAWEGRVEGFGDFSSVVVGLRSGLFDGTFVGKGRRTVQKAITAALKHVVFDSGLVYGELVKKAAKQKLLLSDKEIKSCCSLLLLSRLLWPGPLLRFFAMLCAPPPGLRITRLLFVLPVGGEDSLYHFRRCKHCQFCLWLH